MQISCSRNWQSCLNFLFHRAAPNIVALTPESLYFSLCLLAGYLSTVSTFMYFWVLYILVWLKNTATSCFSRRLHFRIQATKRWFESKGNWGFLPTLPRYESRIISGYTVFVAAVINGSFINQQPGASVVNTHSKVCPRAFCWLCVWRQSTWMAALALCHFHASNELQL